MRYPILALALLLGPVASAEAQVSVGVAAPGINIGINVPTYPDLVQVPGYPVYYAPQADSNYFFYDGLYWVYARDGWYSSSWYNGPWRLVRPDRVPLYVLRVPVRYYRVPPPYFRGWHADEPPRWGQHWGRDWEQRHHGWNLWDRGAHPAPAPLPLYQREYGGDRYPRDARRQHEVRAEHYRHEPQERYTRQQWRAPPRATPAPQRPAAPGRAHPQAQPEPRQERGHDQGQHRGRDRGEGHGEGRH